jgi:hypothetical protein
VHLSLLRFKTPHSAPLANAESFYQRPRRQEWHRKLRSRRCLKADLIGGATFKGRNDEGVAFVVDLSKQKRAEEALQKTQMELAHLARVTASIGHEVSQLLAGLISPRFRTGVGLGAIAACFPNLLYD